MENERAKFTFRNWLVYCAAWVPYALSYVAVFFSQNPNASLFPEIRSAFLNVVPAALCGTAVIKLCENLSWKNHRRAWFFPAHVVFAAAYSGLWYATVMLFMTVELSLRRGTYSPTWFTGYALPWQFFSGLMIYATLASIVYVRQISQSLRLEQRRVAEAEKLAAEANLAALRAQMNPHFLFNTLHSLMALVRYNPAAAENALEQLAEMLRYVLHEKASGAENSNLVSLDDEWRFVENYLSLEKLRLGERLTIESEIEENARQCLLPALTLQPLVENAVKHGIAPYTDRATIFISARIHGENLELEARDSGGGNDAAAVENAAGIGLRLVRRQLRIHYGEQAEMTIATELKKGFAVKISLPAQTAAIRVKESNAGEIHVKEIVKNARVHAYR